MKHGIFIFLLALLITSCNEKTVNTKKSDEGIITYQVSYYESENDNPIIALLPSTVNFAFKNNNISLTTEGYLGFFKIKFISQYKEEKSNILLKILDKKFNYEFPKNQVAFIYNQEIPSKIKVLDSFKTIAGYQCQTAELHFNDETYPVIKVAYTDSIGIVDPNRNTPLNEIKGVLLEFETTMNHVHAKFTAQKISFEKVADEEFALPKDYVLADEATLEKFIVNFK